MQHGRRYRNMKNILENLYTKYNHRRFVPPDPLQFVYRYSDRRDMEIVALLSAVLAYGRVAQIEKSLIRLFDFFGDSPYEFVLNFNPEKARQLKNFKHRFTTGDDICDLLILLKEVLANYDNLEDFFLLGYNADDRNLMPALSQFCQTLIKMYTTRHSTKASRGLRYLLTDPAGGSACKRLNLFLRWMVRNDEVDTGLWKFVDQAKLVVPIDVHMGRLSKILGLHNRKTMSLSAAIEITSGFAEIEPTDPVKYDFALCRIGILDHCTGKLRNSCQDCQLHDLCLDFSQK